MDRSWLVFLANTSKESFGIVSNRKLGHDGTCFIWILWIFDIPNIAITATAISLAVSSRNIDDTCHGNVPLGKFIDSVLSIFHVDEVPEIYFSIHSSRSKSHIIIEPINATNFANMTLVEILRWAFVRVKVVHLNSIVGLSCSEQVTSICELNFTAVLDWDALEWIQVFRKYIHQENLVLNCNNNMESTGMECNCLGIFLKHCRKFEVLGDIVPNLD